MVVLTTDMEPAVMSMLHAISVARARRGKAPPLLMVWCQCMPSGALLHASVRWRDVRGSLSNVGVSGFVAHHVRPWATAAGIPYATIHNGLSPDVSGPDPGSIRELGSFVFHATFERGGAIARRVHAKLHATTSDAPAFHVASYHTPDHWRQCGEAPHPMTAHGSLSKRQLASLLWRCDYFVYPLALPDGRVHHDTYGCVVLEALASGCLVVTWDVACMRSVYGEACPAITLLPPPHDPTYDPHAAYAISYQFGTEAAVDTLTAAVAAMQALSPETRDGMRAAGHEWALRQTWESRADQLLQSIDYDKKH